ncbi:hypothetical protein EDD22DRAFT_960669 [Suillus occidentalis]|nr:hypothetical protein EDD22DRAFT_960669 [Suillus occidentalis]
MSSLYLPDDFDTNSNFASTGFLPPPSFNEVDWNNPMLYTMPLTSDDIAAIMSNTNHSHSDLLPPISNTNNSHSDLVPPMPDPSLPQPSSKTHSPSPDIIIRPRMSPPRLTDMQKVSQKIKRDQRVERTKCLHDAVAEYLDKQKTKIEALSRAHHVTPKQVNDIIGSQTHYRTSCKSQLMHTLIHTKAKEVNADLPASSRYSMAELHEMVVTDPNTKNLTQEQKAAYITALEEHLSTMDRIVKELDDLCVWTGVYGTLFVICGHINNTIQSTMHSTDNSEDFWEDVYEHPMADFLWQYEQWVCTQNQNLNEHDSLGAVQKQVCKLILQGLVAMTGKKDIVMNYSNYKTSIIETYRVQLVGWPLGIKFVNPSNIGTVGDIQKLQDALKTCTCYWAALLSAEVKTHASELDTHRSAGEAIWKPRKNILMLESLRSVKLQEGLKSSEFVASSDEAGEAHE